MSKKIRFLSILTAIALCVSCLVAFASEYDTMLISEVGSDAALLSEYKVTVNGTEIEAKAKTFNNSIMIPLRGICEALGMEVLWDGNASMITVTKLPIYITCSPYSDGYTFARTAPILLGSAPVVENGITYVPYIFTEEILKAKSTISGDTIAISTESDITSDAEASSDAIIPEAPKGEVLIQSSGEGTITVYDFARGEVVANIGEETAVFDAEGNKIEAKDLVLGTIAEVEYADFMTMSLPPITNALKITVKTQELYTVVSGTIDSILNEEFGKQVILGEDLESQIALNLADSTSIIGLDGEAADADALAKATQLTAVVSQAQTFSIPPQSSAYFIRIEK